ncbi:hypothetical protein MTO96_029735 [Rhipicephalus appendiculatus]
MEDTSPEGFPKSFVLGDSSDRRKDWDLLLKRASHPPQAGDTTTNPSRPPRPSSSPSARTRARKLRAATTLLRENPVPSTSRPRTRGTGKFPTPQGEPRRTGQSPLQQNHEQAASSHSHLVAARSFPEPFASSRTGS